MCHVSGTAFSREEAGGYTLSFAVRHLTHSRLKPVPQWACASFTSGVRCVSGTGFSLEEAGGYTLDFAV